MSLHGLLWLLPITSFLVAGILIGRDVAILLAARWDAKPGKSAPSETPIGRMPALSCGVIDRGSDERPFSGGRYVAIARNAGALRGRLAYLRPDRMSRGKWGRTRRTRIPVA